MNEETNKLLKEILYQLKLLNKNIIQSKSQATIPTNAKHDTSDIASNIEHMRQEIMNKAMGNFGSIDRGTTGMGMPGVGMTGAGIPHMPDIKKLIEEKRRKAEAKMAQEVKDAEVIQEIE